MNRHAGVVVAAAALALSVGVGSLDRSAAQDKVPPPARGDDPPGQPERAKDRAALRKRTEELLKAAAKADAKELAGFWTETGEYMRGDDLTIRGRANIEKARHRRAAGLVGPLPVRRHGHPGRDVPREATQPRGGNP